MGCRGFGFGLGLCATLGVGAQGLAAAEYDNPSFGSVPCIVLNEFKVESTGLVPPDAGYRGKATVENICGRTMDVSLCFLYAGADAESERSCFGGVMRPWDSVDVETKEGPVRVTGLDIDWKYAE